MGTDRDPILTCKAFVRSVLCCSCLCIECIKCMETLSLIEVVEGILHGGLNSEEGKKVRVGLMTLTQRSLEGK